MPEKEYKVPVMRIKIDLSFTRNLSLEGEGERCLLIDFIFYFFFVNTPGLKTAEVSKLIQTSLKEQKIGLWHRPSSASKVSILSA